MSSHPEVFRQEYTSLKLENRQLYQTEAPKNRYKASIVELCFLMTLLACGHILEAPIKDQHFPVKEIEIEISLDVRCYGWPAKMKEGRKKQ